MVFDEVGIVYVLRLTSFAFPPKCDVTFVSSFWCSGIKTHD